MTTDSKFKDFQNLYEVRKSVRFELKPGKVTEKFLKNEWFFTNPQNILTKNKEEKIDKKTTFSKKAFEENIAEFLRNSQGTYNALENLNGILTSNEPGIFIFRDIFEPIDKKFFQNLKKTTKLAGTRGVSFSELKKYSQNGVEKILNYFENLLNEVNNQNIEIEAINSELGLSKTDIKKTLKKLSLFYIRIYNFLEKFDLKQEKFDGQIKEKVENILKFKEFFDDCKGYYFMSENQSSGILVRRFGFNERALKRRQPEEIRIELDDLRPKLQEKLYEKDNLEEERKSLLERIKKENFPDLFHSEKWEYIGKKKIEERTKEEQEYYEEIERQKKKLNEDTRIEELVKKLSGDFIRNNGIIKLDKGKKLRNGGIKKEIWNLKKDINNKEKELENNLALTHYAKLLKRDQFGESFYYLVLIPVNNKDVLERSIGDNGDTEILEYKTLTFQAFVKLALSYDGSMGGYFNKDLKQFVLTDKTDEKIIKEYKNYLENNGKWFYERKFNIKFQNYSKSPFEKLKQYIKNIILTDKKNFCYTNFNFEILEKTETLNDYIVEFNKQGYKIYWQKINFEEIKELEKWGKLEIYQIYCKDFYKDQDFFDIEYSIEEQKLEKANRRKKENVSGNKNLFSIYWEDFIKNIGLGNQNIRLNSDSGYFIKPKDESISDNVKGKIRKKRDKIIGTFNLSFNSNKLLSNGYKEEKNIEEFNKKYAEKIKPIKQELTYIGLDRGEKELLTYCVLDSGGNCIKDKNGEYLIGDFNLINIKGKFVKKEDCVYKDKDKKEYKDLIGGNLITKNYKNNKYFELNSGVKLYYDNTENGGLRLETKEGKKIELKDKNGNKVYDYSLIFKLAILRRQIMNKKGEITLNDIQEIRGGYISQIIKILNEWIIEYNGVLVLENLGKNQEKEGREVETNKDKNIDKTFGVTIYQEIETLLNRKYNYFVKKDELQTKFQLTPKIKNVGDLKKIEKENTDMNLGNIIFVNEYNTSKMCPVCGKVLFGHLTNDIFETEMHHYKEGNGYNYGKFLEKAKESINDNCNYNMKINTNGFDFIKSGDDLAAYNIAKKGKEYLEKLGNDNNMGKNDKGTFGTYNPFKNLKK